MSQEKKQRDDALLQPLREELDECDLILLDAIANRFEVIKRIALLKKEHTIPMIQEHRIDSVLDKATLFAKQRNLSIEFVREVYTLLIREACRNEDVIIKKRG